MPKAEAGVRDAGEHHGEVGIVYRQGRGGLVPRLLLLQRNPVSAGEPGRPRKIHAMWIGRLGRCEVSTPFS